MIYLDNAATTSVDPEVFEAMAPYLMEYYGNPNGKFYLQATKAKEAVEIAREAVANFISCKKDEVIFTSGASEGNNFIIKGVTDAHHQRGNHIITTNIEHSSILEVYRFLEKKGWNVTYLSVDSNGKINIDELKDKITEGTILVSVGWANSEIGTIQNVKEIGKTIKEANSNIFFHVDGTQVVGKTKISFMETEIDFLTFSAHKFYGPKGIGATIIKRDKDGNKPEITPLIHGGEQEMGYRGGTLAVANIVGMGKAAEISSKKIDTYYNHLLDLKNTFIETLKKSQLQYKINSPEKDVIPSIINVMFTNLYNETLIKDISDEIAISTGSACSSAKPSHVLKAIGLKDQEIRNSVRFSLGKHTTNNDIITAIGRIENVYLKYRSIFG